MKSRQLSPIFDAFLRRRFLLFLAILSLGTFVIDFRSSAQGQVQVTTADPVSTAQGTVNLNVKVSGKGFKNGAKAKWFVTGTTDPGGVTVNSTTFVNSTELTANITVADTAVISNFDIQVTNSDGRGGKGTELFKVTAKGANVPGDTPVTVSIANTLGGIPLQLQSDGGGPYTNTPSVESIIQAIGDWVLDTSFATSSTRNVWVDLGKPVPGSGPRGGPPVAPFTAALVKVRFISVCGNYNVNMFTIPVGSTVNCPMLSGFDYGPDRYRLQMNPIAGVDVNPETDFVNITCNSSNTSSTCINWSIRPNGLKGGCASEDCSVKQNIARLSKIVTVKGKPSPINQGDFYISFSIGIMNP